MKRTLFIALAALASTQTLAVGRLADVTVADRDTGESLRTHYHRGEYWVAGRPGAHYAIQIRNQRGQRLLAVTSIDGVNVVTGETAAFDQRGYVFDAWSVVRHRRLAQERFTDRGIHVHLDSEVLCSPHRSSGECGRDRRRAVPRAQAAGARAGELCFTGLRGARFRSGGRAAAESLGNSAARKQGQGSPSRCRTFPGHRAWTTRTFGSAQCRVRTRTVATGRGDPHPV